MLRPWGDLDWALGLSGQKNWWLLGCFGPEQRSLVSPFALGKLGLLSGHLLLRFEEAGSPFADLTARRFAERAADCQAAAFIPSVRPCKGRDPVAELREITAAPPPAIVLDITSMPTPFWFYLLSRLHQSPQVGDLLVTYTVPESYPPHPSKRLENAWGAVPLFDEPNAYQALTGNERLIVGAGCMTRNLLAHLQRAPAQGPVDLLIPFPAPVADVQRTWRSVRTMEAALPETRFIEHLVDPHDMSAAFQVISVLLAGRANTASFSPYVPKPIAAAMCLYASLTRSPVHYASPQWRHPDCSLGVACDGARKKVHAYWIKHGHRNLYVL